MTTCKAKNPRDEGAVEIEGMIVLMILIFFLTFLLGLGILYYQQWVVVYTANDTASRIGQSYAYPNADPVMGYVSKEMRSALSPFRYFGGKLKHGAADKGEKYAAWNLKECSLVPSEGDPEINVRTIYDDFAQRHIVVDITVTYRIPLGGALEFFGLKKEVTYHATGRAVCQDVSGYIHSVNSANSLCGNNFNSKILGTVDSVLSFINTIRDAMED